MSSSARRTTSAGTPFIAAQLLMIVSYCAITDRSTYQVPKLEMLRPSRKLQPLVSSPKLESIFLTCTNTLSDLRPQRR
jgi:hypothetical protein